MYIMPCSPAAFRLSGHVGDPDFIPSTLIGNKVFAESELMVEVTSTT
jgi:hypothetical protein